MMNPWEVDIYKRWFAMTSQNETPSLMNMPQIGMNMPQIGMNGPQIGMNQYTPFGPTFPYMNYFPNPNLNSSNLVKLYFKK